jgi:hypothetical protein
VDLSEAAARKLRPAVAMSSQERQGGGFKVRATISIGWGIQKFVFVDEFSVRGGVLRKIKRSRG